MAEIGAVLPGVARFTRVCTYDRPGTTLGPSEFSRRSPVGMPRTATEAVADAFKSTKALQKEGSVVVARDIAGAGFEPATFG
ncbi:MAG TPA: hypothetical protein VHM66_09400, partial [Solirubrobacterales bacterium]|nr:hypothetical protein [Solirubrobacterales bacterium]